MTKVFLAVLLLSVGCAKAPKCVAPELEAKYVAACSRGEADAYCRCTWGHLAQDFTCGELQAGAGPKATQGQRVDACLALLPDASH